MTEVRSETQNSCSFCDKNAEDVALLIAKPGGAICNECVTRIDALLLDPAQGEETAPFRDCSFCSFMTGLEATAQAVGTPYGKGMRLFRVSNCSICDECLELCGEIVAECNESGSGTPGEYI